MSNITDVTQIPGFNQTQYNELIQQANSYRVDVSLVTSTILNAVNNGKSFEEALSLAHTELPRLAPPNAAAMAQLASWPALPAPGAVIMALITEVTADQRQQNKELMWAQTEAVVKSMHDQADKMRNMAVAQLVLGLASAVTTVAGGVAQAAVAAGGGPDASAMLQSTKGQGIGTAVGGGAKALDSVGQFIGSMYQAEFKEMEADQEKMRAMRDSLKDLNDGLKELIQKSLSSAENIQQSKNQATTRILA